MIQFLNFKNKLFILIILGLIVGMIISYNRANHRQYRIDFLLQEEFKGMVTQKKHIRDFEIPELLVIDIGLGKKKKVVIRPEIMLNIQIGDSIIKKMNSDKVLLIKSDTMISFNYINY